MRLTQNALSMFLKRYRSILKKCHVLNVLGGMVLAGALTLGVAVSSAEAADVIKDSIVTGDTNITASDGNVILQAGVNNATGTITATGTPDAAGNIKAINAGGVNQSIIQGNGNSLSLSASGSINSGAMTVNSATAGKDINVTGTLQTGNITASGNISAYDATKVGANAQAYDILVGSSTAAGSITAGGTITGGEITVYGNLIADNVKTFRNLDPTIGGDPTVPGSTSNYGSVKVYGSVNLTGDSVTGRRFDIINTGAAHNELGNIKTGACISIQGTGTDLATVNAGVLAVGGGSFTIADGVQATIKEVSFNIVGRKARIHSGSNTLNTTVPTILDLDKLVLFQGNILAEASWDSQYSMGVIRSVSPDDTRPGMVIGDGNIAVGANSMLGLGQGATLDWLYNLMKTHTGHEAPTIDGVKSVLALNQPLEIQNSFRVFMDGDLHSPGLKLPSNTTSDNDSTFVTTMLASGTFTQGADTMLVINGDNDKVHYTTSSTVSASQVPGAISYVATAGSGTVTLGSAKVAAGAKLLITGAQTGETYVVLGDGFDKDKIEFGKDGAGADTAWQGANLISDNPLVTLARGNDGTVAGQARSASQVFHGLNSELAAILDRANLAHQIGTGEQFYNGGKGTEFLSRALRMAADGPVGHGQAAEAAATIEGAAQMGAVAGVQTSTMGAATAASGAVTTRTSFAQPTLDTTKAVAVHQDADGSLSLDTGLNAGNGMKNGVGVWIMPLYQSNRTWGQKAGEYKTGMSSDLGGIALGADYTVNDMFRFGAAFNVGGGYAQSSGDFNKTENNFNFWGVNLYGGWAYNNFGLSADVGYTSSYNKVQQELPNAMQMGDLKADITSSAWTAGLKAEYKIETSVLDIIPHVGVRYTGLTTDGYDVKNGGVVFEVDQEFQSLWTFPVGVAFSKTITTDSGWSFKPLVDLSVIPAAGDVQAKSRSRIPGVDGEAEMKTQVVDYVTFDGGLGLEMGKDNLSFGINYNIQASEHRTGHGVFATLRYEF